MSDTLSHMDFFLPRVGEEEVSAVREVDTATMRTLLEPFALPVETLAELEAHWTATRDSTRWATLLARLRRCAARDRGAIDAPVALWGDLDEYGPSGRLLFYYFFALELPSLDEYYRVLGVPDDVRDATIGALARHGETHQIERGAIGVDAGWWMLLLARGEMLQVGSLKFHQVHLNVGTLSPEPWLDDEDQARLGEGFRTGDLSLGVHIPARIDLSAEALDVTFARAREVLGRIWPTSTRRLATCQSWMMDDRLVEALGPESRVVGFQRRFELIEPFSLDVDNVAHFVFWADAERARTMTPTSRLQQVVQSALVNEGAWRNRTGWLDFD